MTVSTAMDDEFSTAVSTAVPRILRERSAIRGFVLSALLECAGALVGYPFSTCSTTASLRGHASMTSKRALSVTPWRAWRSIPMNTEGYECTARPTNVCVMFSFAQWQGREVMPRTVGTVSSDLTPAYSIQQEVASGILTLHFL